MSKVMVVGARPNSVGWNIARVLRWKGWEVVTAGIAGEERGLDLVRGTMETIQWFVDDVGPQHVICTVGRNQPEIGAARTDPIHWYAEHFLVNVTAPMRLLQAWHNVAQDSAHYTGPDRHYVAISSNSARVPRSASAAYCASKAALSQALRCKAREALVPGGPGIAVYGYEPGLVRGTPMTEQTAADFPGVPLTRMRGAVLSRGVSGRALAELVQAGLWTGMAFNGCLIPFDANEA